MPFFSLKKVTHYPGVFMKCLHDLGQNTRDTVQKLPSQSGLFTVAGFRGSPSPVNFTLPTSSVVCGSLITGVTYLC